jgi:hypothetical protein
LESGWPNSSLVFRANPELGNQASQISCSDGGPSSSWVFVKHYNPSSILIKFERAFSSIVIDLVFLAHPNCGKITKLVVLDRNRVACPAICARIASATTIDPSPIKPDISM